MYIGKLRAEIVTAMREHMPEEEAENAVHQLSVALAVQAKEGKKKGREIGFYEGYGVGYAEAEGDYSFGNAVKHARRARTHKYPNPMKSPLTAKDADASARKASKPS